MFPFWWHLLAYMSAALFGGGLAAFAVWKATDRAWRQGYADGHRRGVQDAQNARAMLADDVIQLAAHLDQHRPPPGA